MPYSQYQKKFVHNKDGITNKWGKEALSNQWFRENWLIRKGRNSKALCEAGLSLLVRGRKQRRRQIFYFLIFIGI